VILEEIADCTLGKEAVSGRMVNLTRSSAGFLHSHIELLQCSLYATTLESTVEPPADTSSCCLPAKQLFIPGS